MVLKSASIVALPASSFHLFDAFENAFFLAQYLYIWGVVCDVGGMPELVSTVRGVTRLLEAHRVNAPAAAMFFQVHL